MTKNRPLSRTDMLIAGGILVLAGVTAIAGVRSFTQPPSAAPIGWRTVPAGSIACVSRELLSDFGRAARTGDTVAAGQLLHRGCVSVGGGLAVELINVTPTLAHFRLAGDAESSDLWAPLETVSASGS